MAGLAVVTGQPDAAAFYRMAPEEPIKPAGAISVTTIIERRHLTVATLSDILLKMRPTDVIIVSHGSGSGLAIPLLGSDKYQLVSPNLDILVDRPAKESGGQDVAGTLGMTPRILAEFQRRIELVRQLPLNHLEIRACIVGAYPETLEKLRKFFGAQSVAAPTQLDVFARVDPNGFTTDAKAWEQWPDRHGFGRVEGKKGSRVGFEFSVASERTALQAESRAAAKEWVDRHFPKNKYTAGVIYLHGVLAGTALVFPGDVGYRDLFGRVPPAK